MITFYPGRQTEVGRWESWDALKGGWQSRSPIGSPDSHGVRTPASYIAAAPNARLASVLTVGAWRVNGNRPLVVTIDRFIIGTDGETREYQFKTGPSESH
jgi:hypothetical protein